MEKKTKNENFEQSHCAEKSERDPLGFFNIRSVAKYQKMKEDPLGTLKKFRKKVSQSRKGGSLIVPKKLETFCFGTLVKN